MIYYFFLNFFFFQAEDGIRDYKVTGVQTCALPIYWQTAGTMGDRRVRAKDLKPKDLVGIPWRVALALQADGWYLRSDVIWSKSNPLPEGVRDRPVRSHEYLFLLAKQPRYFYDAEAVREAAAGQDRGDR